MATSALSREDQGKREGRQLGLVEAPGTDLDAALAIRARRLDQEGTRRFRDLDELIQSLLPAVPPTGPRTDDVAVLLLRSAA
jgi:hypothetical protein